MNFDLVRRINSDKGELEFNTLVVQGDADEMKELKLSPEVEFAYADGYCNIGFIIHSFNTQC